MKRSVVSLKTASVEKLFFVSYLKKTNEEEKKTIDRQKSFSRLELFPSERN